MTVSVTDVTSRRDRRAFVELPRTLYKGDAKWVPPIQGQMQDLVGWRPSAFYEHAQSQAFLAHRSGQVAGRIVAILNHGHIEHQNEAVGFFGFFESIDDSEVAGRLLDAARGWLKQHGMQAMRGPTSPSLHHECGLLVEGFETDPYFMTPYNHRYYPKLLAQYGCRKARDLLAYIFLAEDLPHAVAQNRRQYEQALRREDINIRSYTSKTFDRDVKSFLEIYNRSLEGLWGTVPMTQAEMQETVGILKWLLVPELVACAEHRGQPIGMALGLLDYNPLIRQIDGRLLPFGLARLLRGRKQIRRVRLMSMHITEEFQRAGLGGVLLLALLPAFRKWGFTEFEIGWTLEDNKLTRQSLEDLGGHLYKRYRIFEYPAAS